MNITAMFSRVGAAAVALLFGANVQAQTLNFSYSGGVVPVTLGPGTYDITVYGAKGGFSTILSHPGGLGAEMEAQFTFASPTTLTLMVGGAGGDGPGSPRGPGGGGGGTFVAVGTTPLIVAGGGGGGGYDNGAAGKGLITNGGSPGLGGSGYGAAGGGGFTADGGPGFWGSGQGYSFLHGGGAAGGGFYGASGGGYGGGGGGSNYAGGGGGGYTGGYGGPSNAAGGGGGSYIDSTDSLAAIAIGTELSGVASPDGSHNGEVIISAIPEPSDYALIIGLVSLLCIGVHRRRAKAVMV